MMDPAAGRMLDDACAIDEFDFETGHAGGVRRRIWETGKGREGGFEEEIGATCHFGAEYAFIDETLARFGDLAGIGIVFVAPEDFFFQIGKVGPDRNVMLPGP